MNWLYQLGSDEKVVNPCPKRTLIQFECKWFGVKHSKSLHQKAQQMLFKASTVPRLKSRRGLPDQLILFFQKLIYIINKIIYT